MNADALSLSLASLDELEKRLLADVELVRQMKLKLQQHAATPASAVMPPPAATAPAPPVEPPPPPHPNRLISDVVVAVRMVLPSVGSPFGIGEVRQQLARQHFREFGASTLRSTLQDMAKAGEILLTQRGIGRGGNRYALPATSPTTP